MESVVQVNDGSKFKPGKCFFCGAEATKVLGTVDINNDRFNGQIFKGFHICDKHMKAVNKIMDGTKDIDEMVEHYENFKTGSNFNLRASM